MKVACTHTRSRDDIGDSHMEKEWLFLYLSDSEGLVLSCIVSSFKYLQIVYVCYACAYVCMHIHVHMCV